MTIAAIVQSITVALPPGRAFALFTGRMGRWWAPGTHIGKAPLADVVIEPFTGGRWFERDLDGIETDWGRVIAWEPPGRVLLAWLIDAAFAANPACESEVEVLFDAVEGGTQVTLTHRKLEAFGPSAEAVRAKLAGGWPGMLVRFGAFAQQETIA